MPNIIAYVALLMIVPATAVVFSRLRTSLAVAGVMIFAVMFLPERVAFDAPAIPPLTKLTMSSLCVLVAMMFTASKALARARIGTGLDRLGFVAFGGIVVTVLSNRDVLIYGTTVLQGLAPYDILSDGIDLALGFVVPYLLGRAAYRTTRDLQDLFVVMVVAALVYIPFILVELRMSPQCHNWVYGFSQHSFAQTIRAGGYRPMVFMAHGLSLAMLLFAGAVSAVALARIKYKIWGVTNKTWGMVLFVVLVMVKSMGALIYALVAIPLVLFGGHRRPVVISAILGLIVLLYPISRTTGDFPTQSVLDAANAISAERMQSLQFRFDNEDALLTRANERVYFGWGGFGRNRVYNEEGRDMSTTDGAWILVIGIHGAVGFFARFGLLVFPIFSAWRAMRRIPGQKERNLLAALVMIVALGAVDLVPNGLFSHIPVFLAGCLSGLSAGLPLERLGAAARRVMVSGMPRPSLRS